MSRSQNQMPKTYPSASKISDIAGIGSMMVSSFGPRKLSIREQETLVNDTFLLADTLTHLAALGSELRHGQYSNKVSGQTQVLRNVHCHIVPSPGKSISAGSIRLRDVEIVSSINEGAAPHKAKLDGSSTFSIEVIDGYDEDGIAVFKPAMSLTCSGLEFNVFISRISNACFGSVGTLFREVSATLYKSTMEQSVIHDAARAAIMRLQDNHLQQACERASNVNMSDGEGPLMGVTSYFGGKLAIEKAPHLIRFVAPSIANWIFSGKALGSPDFKVEGVI